MHTYTVILYENGEPPVETNWTSYMAAKTFADKIFERRHVFLVKIWNGFSPENGEVPGIVIHDDLLYLREKGTGSVIDN